MAFEKVQLPALHLHNKNVSLDGPIWKLLESSLKQIAAFIS